MNHENFVSLYSKLPEQKRKLVREKFEREGIDFFSYPIVKRPDDAGSLNLSFSQQRLWLIDQMDPGNIAFNIPLAIRMSGQLDIPALRRSLNEIVRRHEALRTCFPPLDGVPVQQISPVLELELSVRDLSGLPEQEREAAAVHGAETEARTSFDLARGPLVRAELLRKHEQEHILLFTMHHIVSDGWSLGVLVNEIVALYTAFVKDLPSPLPELPIQYADFALWQRQWLSGVVLQKQMDFWVNQLAGAPALLTLPTDRPRPAIQTNRGANFYFDISPELTSSLHALNRKTRTTLFMLLTAAFNILLARYSGQDDISVGTPIANRNRAEIEPLIGFFVNTLVLRTRLHRKDRFSNVLERVRDTALAAYLHQDVPFEQLLDTMKPDRQLSHSQLFQVMIVLQNAPIGNFELPGLALQPVPTANTTTKFDLMLSVTESSDQLFASLGYNIDLFDAATIQRMARHFRRLLEAAVHDPDCLVQDMPMLSEEEHQQQLRYWNETAYAYPSGQLIHELFEAQAARTPNKTALVFEGKTLSYAELNARANQLARYLRDAGVGPDRLVAVCMERSLEMLVALLAILKAGAAYVPLDTGNPAERLHHILENAQALVLLTQHSLAQQLARPGQQMICLDTDWADLNGYASDNLAGSATTPDNLAYVIYTSGSTGQPKGVQITHRNVVQHMYGHISNCALTEHDRVLQFASISFDASVEEIFPPLIIGATLVMRPVEFIGTGAAFLQLLEQQQISVLDLPTAFWQEWTNALVDSQQNPPASVRLVIIGGEKAAADTFKKWTDNPAWRHVVCLNTYGPTEATISVCTFEASHDRAEAYAEVPIGKPSKNARIYLLDAYLQPVPIGVAGHLHIAGDGLARGYLQRADLTAEQFIPDPFANLPGSRMYRSGDVAAYLPDGNIKYLGRVDEQIKIRGFRIELGEVEAALSQLPAVAESIVIAHQEPTGEKFLAAYVVLHAEHSEVNTAALRKALAAILPLYMIPAHILLLERLPLTLNGKVDRQRLPAPESGRGERDFQAAQGETEHILASIWATVLKLDRVSTDDNFFELGGHSLLATRVIAKAAAAFEIELPLRTLFEAPTVASLAERINSLRQVPGHAGLTKIPAVPRDVALLPSFSQTRLWFIDQLDHQASATYHIPFALRLSGKLDRAALQASLDCLVARHEILRTSFLNVNGSPFQQIAASDTGFDLREIDCRGLSQQEQAAAIKKHLHAGGSKQFDLASGPLIRGQLLCLSESEHVLHLVQHHIISDGWSVGVLLRELSALYSAFCQGVAHTLPALPIQYADYAAWQRGWLRDDTLQKQIDFWRSHLSGAPDLLTLPADHARPAQPSYQGSAVAVRLDPALSQAVRELSQRHGVTPFMSLLAAWAVLLSRLAGQDDVVIGTPVANRQHTELEPLIGFFANTLALRIQPAQSLSVASLLAQVKALTLDALTHQDLPFEQVVDIVKPVRSLKHNAIFQAMFVLNNVMDAQTLTLPGLNTSSVPLTIESAHFDLSLSLTDTGNNFTGSITYSSDLFEPATVQRMAGYLHRLLQGMVADDQQSLAQLPLLSQEQTQELLAMAGEASAVSTGSPAALLVHQQFEQIARLDPQALAVSFAADQLSYEELNIRANQLAHHLTASGLQPGDRVAVCLERGMDMLVALLAIFKAGACYLPLDLAYPQDRLAYMLADAAPAAVLTQGSAAADLPVQQTTMLLLDEDGTRTMLAQQPVHNPDLNLDPSQPAYVIYTSGSTGMPKGVVVEHRQLANTIAVVSEALGFRAGDVLPNLASSAFDISLLEFLMPLCRGGRVSLLQKTDIADLPQLVAQTDDASFFHAVPSLMERWLQFLIGEGGPGRYPALRCLLVGGEAVPLHLLQKLARQFPDVAIVELYGPTEATIVCSMYRYDASHDASLVTAPHCIGRPFKGSQIYLLDACRNPVPAGVAGEIYIGGDSIARGYLHRPDLTAERFVDNPFAKPGQLDADHARLYKTGDMGRYLADGNIEFLGRNDFQVKIRGYRIELGEIEARLLAYPGLAETVVTALPGQAGEQRLVAYLVARPGVELAVTAVRKHLALTLADYMIPAAFVCLAEMPRLPNGKLNRHALPAPDQSAVAAREYEAPQGDIESGISEIWREILGLQQVGRHDDFFELGGHSLLATQVISKMSSTFAARLPLRALFEASTVSALAPRLQAMLTDQVKKDLPAITSLPRPAQLPLSFSQQRLWLLDQYAPGNPAYNMPLAVRMQGKLEVAALRGTLNDIVRKHESLRTNFVVDNGMPVQIIAPALQLALAVEDLSSLPELARNEQVAALVKQEASTPFDLAAKPLIRASLLRLEAEVHVLLLTMHHIVSDAWSIGILVREIEQLYGAHMRGQVSSLAELPVQYADFALWQRQWLSGEELKKQSNYWMAQLSGGPALLTLPLDHPRPPLQSYAGAALPVLIPEEVTAGLRALNKQTQTTLFMVLLAAFNVLLSRYARQNDICVGTFIANRNHPEIESLIGFFVNTLALRTEVDDKLPFTSLLEQVRRHTLDAYENQDIPFEQLVDMLKPVREPSHTPIFQVMLVLQNAAVGELQLPGLELQLMKHDGVTSKFDLTLNLNEADNQLRGYIEYNTSLFEPRTMERMATHLGNLLKAIASAPACRIADIPMLDESEAQQLLRGWNDTARSYPDDVLLHHLFERQAVRSPDEIALVYETQQLTYAELNARSNQLACHLRSLGAGPDSAVGICAHRSLEMFVALLAVLKAGAAYVPLDPAYPQERLLYMIEDANPSVLLTQADVLATLTVGNVSTFCLDTEWHVIDAYPTENLANLASPEHLAYIIYTSGSTGRPKGTSLSHAALYNLLAWSEEALPKPQRALQFASLSFDASFYEVFTSWQVGGTVFIIDEETRKDVRALAGFLARHAIQAATLPVAVLQLLAQIARLEAFDLAALTEIIATGEALVLTVDLIDFIRDGGRRLHNHYGPSETHVVTAHTLRDADWQASLPPTIGVPIANSQIYLLDNALQPVPAGVSGELYIAGANLARGYHGRSDITAEKFIPDPFSLVPGKRMYKTGDLARYLADGCIEYQGRIDSQVKIRGFRIELGEIETALGNLACIAETVVVASGEASTEKRLIAYVVLQADAKDMDAASLRRALSQTLPDYMIPAQFVMMDVLPLNPNGKIDRKALPLPDVTRGASNYVAPRSHLEKELAGIWSEVLGLGLQQVGIHDNFFDLGGHSLLSIQLFYQIRQRLHFDLPISSIFSAPTIVAMGKCISEGEFGQSMLVPLQTSGEGTPLFCLHPVGGQVFFYQLLAQQWKEKFPVYGIQSAEAAGLSTQFEAVDAMAEVYADLIVATQASGPYRLLGWSSGGVIALAVAAALERRDCQVEYVGLLDSAPLGSEITGSRAERELGALLTTLAAIRHQSFSQPEVDSLLALLKQKQQAGIELFGSSRTGLMMEILECAGIDTAKQQMFDGLESQLLATLQHLELLSGYLPQPVAAPVQVLYADKSTRLHAYDYWQKPGHATDAAQHHLHGEQVPGDHYNMLGEPHVTVLAARIAGFLAG